MKMWTTLFITGVVLFSTPYAKAGSFYTGNVVYERCRNKSFQLFCSSYIAGVADGLQLAKAVCLPEKFTVGQARDIVINYFRDHPEKRHYTAASTIGVALQKAFKCSQ